MTIWATLQFLRPAIANAAEKSDWKVRIMIESGYELSFIIWTFPEKISKLGKNARLGIHSSEAYAPDPGADTLRLDSQKIARINGFETISCSGSESSSGTTVAGVSYGPALWKAAIISVTTLCVGDVGDAKICTEPPKSSPYFDVKRWAPDNHLQNRWRTKYRRFGSVWHGILKKTKPIGRCPTEQKVVLGRIWWILLRKS